MGTPGYREGHLRQDTKDKYYRVCNEYLANGFQPAKAYQSVYPDASDSCAASCFHKIRKIPEFANYLADKRKEHYEARCIDIERVMEELADVAFIQIGDERVPVQSKVKALEILLKQLKEDEAAKAQANKDDTITIELEDEDES